MFLRYTLHGISCLYVSAIVDCDMSVHGSEMDGVNEGLRPDETTSQLNDKEEDNAALVPQAQTPLMSEEQTPILPQKTNTPINPSKVPASTSHNRTSPVGKQTLPSSMHATARYGG